MNTKSMSEHHTEPGGKWLGMVDQRNLKFAIGTKGV